MCGWGFSRDIRDVISRASLRADGQLPFRHPATLVVDGAVHTAMESSPPTAPLPVDGKNKERPLE